MRTWKWSKSHGYIQWPTGAPSLYDLTEKTKCWSQSTQLQCRWTKQFEAAKDKETDQWISNSVFKIVRRAGVLVKRIMAMRWILAWKESLEGTNAKSRLVAKWFTDPDLLTIRAEAPTLSKIGRHCLIQMACSRKMKVEVGDVSTAFLQGDKEENDRDVYLGPIVDLRTRLNIGKESILKLIGSVYGLRMHSEHGIQE